ncbi:MAG: aldo/keto reductase [Vagococcus sp.]|uniref:aldo/keto reductase n=1 Tax=Vagococcus sp. TaxID=1933889 RepID=UPI002FC6D358
MKFSEETYRLNNGERIPMIGFGTWQAADGKEAEKSVLSALEAGYRHIDTAAIYKNEESIGRAIKKSGIKREELFVTTKLWNDSHSYELAKLAIEESLKKLDLDYVDLYLIHWPNPLAIRGEYQVANTESWRAMEEAVSEGKIKSIGVSNFHPHHLKELLKTAIIKPVVNQIYLNPSDSQPELVNYCQKQDILLEAYSPLGTGQIFEILELKQLTEKYQKTVAQIVLRWSIQHGFLPLPKSVTAERIAENINIFDFELSEDDMLLIDGFYGKAGSAKNPDEVEF